MNSINKTARFAGFLYLLLAPIGFFGIMYVPSTLIVEGDAATTIGNILANESLFRWGIVSSLVTQLLQIVLVLVLYKLLKAVNRSYAVLMVVFILVAVPIAMLNELNNFAALQLLSGTEFLSAFSQDQLNIQVMFFLQLREYGIIIAQIFWGLWLFPMGYLVFKSGFIPKIIGILLMIGCFGYMVDSFSLIIFPNFGITFSEFTFLGEVLLPLWLLIKGVNVEEWERLALKSE